MSSDHQKWLSKLLGYDFEIQYWLGLENKAADALSRVPATPSLQVLSAPVVLNVEELQQQVELNNILGQTKANLQQGKTGPGGFALEHGRWCMKVVW